MYKTCPKCDYQRQEEDGGSPDICPACGLVFSKWERYQPPQGDDDPASRVADMSPAERERFADRLLRREAERSADPTVLWGRTAAFVVLLFLGLRFILMDMESNAIGNTFMHNVNLAFHEAGHVLFRPFGEFMTILGGSLMQLIMPLVVAGAFLFKQHDRFGASVGVWWFGQSMMDLAPYINDARAMVLPLVGGGTGRDRPGFHDWNNLLSDLGLLSSDHAIARAVDALGELTLLGALAWGGYLLYRQFHRYS